MILNEFTPAIRCDKPTNPRFIHREGRVYGRLTVKEFWGRHPKYLHKTIWLCSCECGREIVVPTANLSNEHTRSCGCFRKEVTAERRYKHGKSYSREHRIWRLMLVRCSCPTTQAYPSYGGRGIVVCERWRKFESFYADMGDAPMRHSLDRIDNDGPYSPENCRWATQERQCRNTRRTVMVTFRGRTQSLPDWADELGLKQGTLRHRLRRWSVEKALTDALHR